MRCDKDFSRIFLLALLSTSYVQVCSTHIKHAGRADSTTHGTTPIISKTTTPSIHISTSSLWMSSASPSGVTTSSTSSPPMTSRTTAKISKTSISTSQKSSITTLPSQSTSSNRTPNISKTTLMTTRHSLSPMTTNSSSIKTTPNKSKSTRLTSEFTSVSSKITSISTALTSISTQPLSASTRPASVSSSPVSTFSTATPQSSSKTPTSNTSPHVTSPTKTSTNAHVSTLQTTLTMTPSTTTLHPHLTKFGVRDKNGKYCILLLGEFTFSIPYTKDDNTSTTATVKIPQSATVNGTCNKVSGLQDIVLVFFQDWSLTITMGRPNNRLEFTNTGNLSYSWDSLSFAYSVDGHFDKPNNKGKSLSVHTKSRLDKFKAQTGGFYRCMSSQTTDIETVSLQISNLQYLAYGQDETASFPNTGMTECSADKDAHSVTRHTTVIIASILSSTAVIILLVIGVINCRRKTTEDTVYKEL